ncbi:MAG: lysoplasmalogenase [Clostridia bacterium]|nr:lysoplasmalogenase [Clostridia bacterium]
MLLILLIAAGTILETLYIMQSYRRRGFMSVFLKTAASCFFVAIANHCCKLYLSGHVSEPQTLTYMQNVVIGLSLGLAGDFLLALRYVSKKLHNVFFLSGTAAFLAGHIFYILAILALVPNSWQYAIPIALVAMGAALFYNHVKEVKAGKIMPAGIVYIFCVIFMASCSLTGAFLETSRALFMFFLGGLCFSLSDNMLVVLSFGKNDSPYRNAVLHVLYYMAQIFIALSILFLS